MRRHRGGRFAATCLIVSLLFVLGAGAVLAANQPPTVSFGFPTPGNVSDKGDSLPFARVSVDDPDNDLLTIKITFPDERGTFPTSVDLTKSLVGPTATYQLSPRVASAAQAYLRSLIFSPAENRIQIPLTETTTFTVTAIDPSAAQTNDTVDLVVFPVNDASTLVGGGASSTTDKISVLPFATASIQDVDNRGTQQLTLTISLDDTNKGTFNNFGGLGFSLVGTNFTLSGTSNSLTTAIRQLRFVPSENRLAVDLIDTTTFKMVIDDSFLRVTNTATTVAATSINDVPLIGGLSTVHRQVQTGGSTSPFSSATITDADRGDDTNRLGQTLTLTVTVTGASLTGQLEGPGGFSGTTYQVGDVTPQEAAGLLRGLVYRASTLPVAGTNTYGFTVVVTDGHGGTATDSSAAVDVFTLTTAPTLSGTRANQPVNDNTTIAPFSSVTVISGNGTPVIATIRLDEDGKGQLISLGGFTKVTSTSPVTYTATGSSDQITSAMRQLAFQPTGNRLGGATNETVVFTIGLSSSGKTNPPDSSTTVIVAPVNDSPGIAGIAAPANMQDSSSTPPFPGVLISDVDESGTQRLTATVALDNPANGSFAPASLSSTNGLVVTTFVFTNSSYVAVGTPQNLTAAIRRLVFVPTPQLLPIGLATNVVLNITADDGYGGVTLNSGTRLHVSAVSGAPFVSVPSQQPLSVALVSPLRPLGLVEVQAAQDITVTIQVNASAGTFGETTLATNSFTNTSAGVYVFHGSSTNATAAIQNLEFVPDANLLPGTVIRFTISAVDAVPNSFSATLDITLRRTQRSWIVTKSGDYLPDAADTEKFGTLRKAVEDASSNDHITFDLTSGDPNLPNYPAIIRLVNSLSLGKNLTFDGPGANLLTISGGDTNGVPAVQLFLVEAGVAAAFNGLTLAEGFHPFAGGGVEVQPTASLKLSYCTVRGCVAGVWGGGIDVDGGTLRMDHCLIQSNSTSVALGQGGGGVSLYTDRDCMIVDTTFTANQQLSSGGLGGGALYVENSDAGHSLEVSVTSCTFSQNKDAAGLATSIRPNVFDANVLVQNSIFADAQGVNLYLDGSGMIFSLGGNVSDDSTKAIFSIGGVPYDHVILDGFHDLTNQQAGLLSLAANGGPTLTLGLNASSPAIDYAVSNASTARFFGTLGTDQRGFWRKDGHPDIGAFERAATNRIVMEEIHFAPAAPNTNDEFIEFYVPRDSASVNLGNYQLYVGGVLRHTFASTNIAPGQALVLFSKDAVNTSLPAGVASQLSSNRLSMDNNADTITLRNASTQTVLEVSYVGAFVSSDTNNANFLTNGNQSIVMSPQFQGCYLPYQRVALREGGPGGRTNDVSGPGQDVAGNSFSGGNAPPRAFNDFVATDALTPVSLILALANDIELDAADALRIVGVGVTNAFPSGVSGELIPPGESVGSSTSLLGATVTIVSNGTSISYDPNTSVFLRSLPQGSNFVDTFQYTILDSSNGVDHVRGVTVSERSNNIIKATATISVTVTGVNSAPTPQADGFTTNPLLITTEDGVLDFTTLTNLLTNDTDPNTDDAAKLKIVAIHPTPVFSNALQIVTSNGALVTLDIRFNPAQTHIIYDPRLSPILLQLSTNHFLVDTFYYAVVDSHGVISSASVQIKVFGLNDAPTANRDTIPASQGGALVFSPATLLANDTDPDTNDVPRLVSVSSPSTLGAQVFYDGTNVIYDPTLSTNLIALARKETTNDTFTYVMTDGAGISRTSTVTVVVTGVNDRPVAAAYSKVIDEDTVLFVPPSGVLSNSFDPDVNGHAPDDVLRVLTFSNRLTAAGAPVSLNPDGSFNYDPRVALNWLPANSNWVDSFAYTILDGSLTMANDDLFSVQGNSTNVVLPVLANDVALAGTGGSNFITDVSVPRQGGSVSLAADRGTLVYTPAVNFSGVDTFIYSISDGQGGTDTAQVTVLVSINAVNVNLVANPDSFTVSRGTTVNLNVLANDNIRPASGGTLTIFNVGTPSNGGAAALFGSDLNNSIVYTPNPTNAVPYTETFSYRISGGGPIQATGVVTVTVVTNVLTANDDNFTILAESGNTILDVLANDRILPGTRTNLTILSVQGTNAMVGVVSINAARTRLLYKPRIGVFTQQEPFFTYTISDGAGGLATASVSINVQLVGLFANDDVFTVMKNSSNSLAVLGNDSILPDSGETLIVTDTGLGANAPNHGGMAEVLDSLSVGYTPAPGFVGLEAFTYEISDGTIARAEGQVFVQVIDTAILRTSPDMFEVARGSANTVLDVLANDFRLPRTPNSLTITALDTTGLRGVVTPNGSAAGNFLFYTPAAGFVGTELFGYTCVDSYGNVGSNTVTVKVGRLVPNDDIFSVISDSVSNELDVLANDIPFPDSTSVRLIMGVSLPDQGGSVSFNGAGNRVIYSPGNHFVGTENFTYQVSDDSGKIYVQAVSVKVVRAGSDRDTNIVTVTVTGVNDAPTITGTQSTNITDKGTATPFSSVTIGDVDEHGLQILTVRVLLDNPAKGVLVNLGGFTLSSPGTYVMQGTPTNITTALRGLVFDPTENRITVPTSEITRFTITADDGYVLSPVTNNATTVNVTAVNDAPVISGTLAGQRVYAHLTIRPFVSVLITEIDDLTLQPLLVRVTLDQPTHGYLTSLGGFLANTNGVYTLSNTTAALATAALRGLIFVPTVTNRLARGGSETNRLTISVNDGFAPTVVDNTTTVIAVDGFIKKLMTADGTINDAFGSAVSASRDLVVVGMPSDSGNTNKSGSAYIFGRNTGGADAWGQVKKLVGSDCASSDKFGYAVSLNGDTIAVGSPINSQAGIKSGAVYIYYRNQGGPNAWGQVKKIIPPDGVSGDEFGNAVSVYGDILVVGAHKTKQGSNKTGSAYLFGRNQGGANNWGFIKKLNPADGLDADDTGFSVTINGDTVVVGSRNNTGKGSHAGAVYIYDRNQGGTTNWGLTKKLFAADGKSSAGFGYSVALSGDLLVVGTPFDTPVSSKTGSAYVFSRNEGGTTNWGQLVKLVPFDGGNADDFGFSVTIDGEIIAVGSENNIDHGILSGATYVYARAYPGLGPWNHVDKLIPPTGDADDFGYTVSLSQGTLVVGSHFDDSGGNRYGSTFIYRLKFNNAPYVAIPIPDQRAAIGVPFTFTLPNGTFADPDIADTLTLSLSFLPTPPAWLTFNPATATFGSTPPPDQAGTFPVVIRATDSDGANVAVTFNIVIPGSSPFTPGAKSLWRSGYFDSATLANSSLESTVWGDNADPDHDGLSNSQEYFFGTNPLQANPSDWSPLTIQAGATPGSLLVTFKRRNDNWRLVYSLETSSDFAQWNAVDSSAVVQEWAQPAGPGVEQVTQQFQVPDLLPFAPGPTTQFFRIKVMLLVPDVQ